MGKIWIGTSQNIMFNTDAEPHYSSGECKLKPQWSIITTLTRMVKI